VEVPGHGLVEVSGGTAAALREAAGQDVADGAVAPLVTDEELAVEVAELTAVAEAADAEDEEREAAEGLTAVTVDNVVVAMSRHVDADDVMDLVDGTLDGEQGEDTAEADEGDGEQPAADATPECPTCKATGKKCKRPSGHDAPEWHVARRRLLEDQSA
jgi:hypothetical protein